MYNKGWCIVEKDNSVKKIVDLLQPLIKDLDDCKKTLSDRKDELEKVSRLIAYTKDNIQMVGIYADQDLIVNNLDKVRYNKDDYKASCYLLKSENDVIKALPQYEKAYNIINDIIEYFKLYKAELIVEIQELNGICSKKDIEKKYYDLLSCPNPLVEDAKEFVEFMREHSISDDEIIDILYTIIRDNNINYELKNN